MMKSEGHIESLRIDERSRRDFLIVSTSTLAATGVALSVWPLIDSLNPASDTLALASTDLNLQPIERGQRITVVWQGKPVFVDRRTPEAVTKAKADDGAALPDPEKDADRVQREEWLIVVGICTHLGCIPLGQREGSRRGDFGGWFCPCHGSHYDTSGRIRKGPAPRNLVVPPYAFPNPEKLVIG
ncbi:ubiquinol-cytochrome c reductase iron-sulfur subunit [Alphaproteobacteria bacterium LMO-S08]|nr:ubiquinol-cytochrome c reductase iron-sulfur subunit [Alphaproteobacteria bacterium LMO-S08]